MLTLTGALPGTGASSHAAAGPPGEPSAYSDDSIPAREVTMIGATPSEHGAAPNETWGVGKAASGAVVVRYSVGSEGQGEWTLGPGLEDSNGQPLAGFELDTPELQGTTPAASPLAGQMTATGSGVLAGYVGHTKQVLLVREPGSPENAFQETDPSAEAQLESGERLLSFTRAPLIAPLDEPGGHAGAFVVPVREANSGVEEVVLHWEAATKHWTREPIELPASAGGEFRVLGIGASSPENAWLVGQLSTGGVTLFHREDTGGEAVWRAAALQPGGKVGEPLRVPIVGPEGGVIDGEDLAIPGAGSDRVRSQVLTVTSQGVWIDGERPEARASTTVFFNPEGGGAAQPTLTSWCSLESSPTGTRPCEHELPEALPTGASRSIAWPAAPGSQGFGERVITGLPEGVSLRLEGDSFRRVLALGGSSGSAYGAAFANAREGWLGDQRIPVHLTLEHIQSNLTPWPVPFRHALLAVAPAPDEPGGSLSSGALAVGDQGEVARYHPGVGWQPESLVAANGRVATPRLRAVAWPTRNHAYAVGDEGQMWLWRGETERWEPDPAAPYQFEGNLLGIAFDPTEPARGFAVGEGGVLLAYGKRWTQVTLPEESPCQPEAPGQSSRCTWSDTSFTSVAFAGSEAIVAYRVLPNINSDRYVGGLLVNEGSGWHIDMAAEQAMDANVPWAVAGLPDGGAAFGSSQTVYEREAPDAPWRATPTPLPGGSEPGSLALFREGGALRAVVSASVPDTYEVEKAPEAPPGSPPTLIAPYPLGNDTEAGVLRQTATGWRDEEHELNDAREPPGNWSYYDTPYEPDPVAAVLIDSTGSEGWAVGGFVESEEHEGLLDTADVDRIGSEPIAPVGAATAPIKVEPNATFAIGGNAQCAAPCAARASARIGPDVWLSAALQRAAVPGVRAFLYTGPRLPDTSAITGPRVGADQFSYMEEFERYASILSSSPLPVFAASTPTDRNEAESESSFESVVGPFPLGGSVGARAELSTLSKPEPSCTGAPNCQSSYYAFTSSGVGGAVRVVVLDDASETAEVMAPQREWLEGQLREAATAGTPAIVVGNADLSAQRASGGHPAATEVVCALVKGGASAYFFDAVEQNITAPLECGGGSRSVPSFGSGTLGYVSYEGEKGGAFLGASGFLLAEVNVAAAKGNVAPVTARLIPNIGELALEAHGGTLLRRSQAVLFAGLARRPRAGNRTQAGGAPRPETDPYIPIPSNCVGATCASGLMPEYAFSSSRPEVGNFVEPNLQSSEPDAVLLGADGKPIPDPRSGLFCAYNAGTTTVTISAGGLSASLPVTVQAGSVRAPCGTQPISVPITPQQPGSAAAPSPFAGGAGGISPTLPPVPPPSPPAAAPHPVRPPAHAPLPFFSPVPSSTAALAFAPAPLSPPAEPIPPSGTTAVNSPVVKEEEESEEAPESASANAALYSPEEHEPPPVYLLGLIVLAAFVGATTTRRIRGRREPVRVAPATLSTIRAQRRMTSAARRRRG